MRQPEIGDGLRGISRAVTGPGQGSLWQAPAASRRLAEPGEAAGAPGGTAGGQERFYRLTRENSLLPPGLPRAGHRHRLLSGCGGGVSTEHREKVVFGRGGRHTESRSPRSLPRFPTPPKPAVPGPILPPAAGSRSASPGSSPGRSPLADSLPWLKS